jgi:hypothetical protein
MQNRLGVKPGGQVQSDLSNAVLARAAWYHARYHASRILDIGCAAFPDVSPRCSKYTMGRLFASNEDCPCEYKETRFMNIYFSCSLTGGRGDEEIYIAIVDHLVRQGHEVPTAHLAHPGVMDLERVVVPSEVYQRDMAWLRGCDALIAEVSTPSHGVGYEIAYALGLKKPVLCCHHRDVQVSKMITGNDSPVLHVRPYLSAGEALDEVDAFLTTLGGG